jgi:hypothetical protein
MASYTEAQIREAIETVIKQAAPDAVVFPWWNLSGDINAWPGKLVPQTGPDKDKVHGYVVSRGRTEPIHGGDDGRINACRVRRGFRYDIVGLHFHDTGNRMANSDLKFNAELDRICDKFNNALDFRDTALARSHVPTFDVFLRLLGGAMRHCALGSLMVEQC